MGAFLLSRWRRFRWWRNDARRQVGVLCRHRPAFLRWAWLRLTGKTAYRFAPLFKEKSEPYSGWGINAITQANGWRVPGGNYPPLVCDWRKAIEQQLAKKRKKG